ncbi:PREDICTED: hemicentin-1-like [Amphimedon queenslandica]|uniref:Uncharacterized protein n=1 Tax=Amphimedon queenslandica TaxID=400682 RepID=A0A1X7VLR5_AMPQE|nr:PREDICTED: hemicentin-1-like [Amphimedon queenslandica]|eukprot:XP_019864284.1 PREDICTED: hemicentin-1-like [Amphimedon queenslandica]
MTGAICHSSEDENSIGIISNCTTGGLRLVNVITRRPNAQSFDGVVQMCINGLWKPLCHNETTDNEAIGKVTCDQLGFGKQRIHSSKSISHQNPGVHLNLNCNGSESSLLDCAQIIHLSKFRLLTCNFNTKVHCSAPPVRISSLTPESVNTVVSEGSYSPVKLTCSATGTLPLVVRWNFLSTNLTVAYLRTFTNTVSGPNLTSVLTISDPSPASNGEYECIVENSHGVTRSRKSIVTIKVPPTIDVESEPFAEEGASAVMLCTGEGYPAPLLSFSKNGVRILTSSSSCHMTSNSVFPGVYRCTLSYSITNVNMSDAGSYICEASTNGTFPVQYKTTYLSVWGAPKVVKKPANTTIFLHPSDSGVVANLTCIVKGLPLPVIDWYRIAEGTLRSLIEGNSEEKRWRIVTKSSLSESTVHSSLLISNIRSEDQGMYQCIGANSLGSVRTEASLYVHAAHSAIIQALPSSVLIEGSKLTLLCSVYHQLSAKEYASFTWTKDDEPIKQKIPFNSVMTFKSISLADSGQYQCIYRTSTGQTLRASINIRVEAHLKIQLKGDSPVVFGHKMWLMIESNKPTSGIHCSVGRLTKDCSSGEVTFDDLSCSIHNIEPYPLSLTVNATSALGEVSLIVRKFYMDSPLLCSVHLINEGITVNGSQVMVEFTGMGPVKYYKCSLDSNRPRLCSSPLVLNNVSGGYHTLTIRPRGCYSRVEKPLSESFMIA